MIFNLSEHPSIANRFVAELRDVNIQKDRMRFRRNLQRISEVLGYEISKTLKFKSIEVETPLGIAKTRVPDQRIVLGTILRAGLPMHRGLLNVFDDADNAFLSAYRRHHKDGSFEINLEYISCPNLDDCVFILSDPMLATGSSVDTTFKAIKPFGTPSQIHVVTAIACTSGLNYIKRIYPKVSVWMGALDEELTARSFIVPGLGDAGDLCFGEKMVE